MTETELKILHKAGELYTCCNNILNSRTVDVSDILTDLEIICYQYEILINKELNERI